MKKFELYAQDLFPLIITGPVKDGYEIELKAYAVCSGLAFGAIKEAISKMTSYDRE